MGTISDNEWNQIKDDVFLEIIRASNEGGLTQAHKNTLSSLTPNQLVGLCEMTQEGETLFFLLAKKEPVVFEAVVKALPKSSAESLLMHQNNEKKTVFHALTESSDFVQSMPDLSMVGLGLGSDEVVNFVDPKQLERDKAVMSALLALKDYPRFEATSAFHVLVGSKVCLRRAYDDDPASYRSLVKEALDAGPQASCFARVIETHQNDKASPKKTATYQFFKEKVDGDRRRFSLFSKRPRSTSHEHEFEIKNLDSKSRPDEFSN